MGGIHIMKPYKQLTVEMIDKVIEDLNKEEDNHFVLYIFGTVEQVSKTMNEYNNVMREYINKN